MPIKASQVAKVANDGSENPESSCELELSLALITTLSIHNDLQTELSRGEWNRDIAWAV